MGFGPIGGTPVRFLKRLALRLVLAALVAAGAAATFVPLNAAPSPAAAGAPRPDGTPVRLDSDNAPAAARAGRAFVEARLQ
ncbi:MAG: hypothetical protein FJW23_16880, partial [Acidimicrobiia bacterium]|nr:hypothetical protein [Acidimicrobiia bacterium]